MPEQTPADEVLPPVSPESQADEAPETPPEVPDISEPEKVEEAPVEPSKEDQEAVLKKRLSGALQENEKRGEELRRAQRLQVDMVKESPNYIHRIAQEDPTMANKVIQEVWGDTGIRSYKQLQEHIKLQELKEVNPEIYETKKELLTVKSELEKREERDQKRSKTAFLTSKGIKENPYDPMYEKLEKALSHLNPRLVQEDYDQALSLAWNLVSDNAPLAPSTPKPTMVAGGGMSAVPPVKTSQGRSEFSWAYDAWKKQK